MGAFLGRITRDLHRPPWCPQQSRPEHRALARNLENADFFSFLVPRLVVLVLVSPVCDDQLFDQ
jgi:hypothetical protein